MQLQSGDKLGSYEILAPIGKGGMGEVYKAHDSRVGRDVAIKVAGEKFSERFEREARSIAALNHTNLCHLYDVGPNYLVMEFVDGEPLKGPLTFDEALPIIYQLIDGMEAAHEKNIVHRDLKPANIKITHDGVVKILDFGLAKSTDISSSGSVADSPTMTMGATVAGTILGTAAYMSPEQARGRAVDRRSDIFSFGAVVYELLTGNGPFAGDTAVECMGAVLHKDPDWTLLPPRAERLLRWCLEKDRKKRLASISDARRVLEESPIQASASEPVTIIQKQPPSKLPWALAAGLALSLAGFVAFYFTRTAPRLPDAVSFTFEPPSGTILTNFNANGPQFAVSPDGRSIAFIAQDTKSGADSRTIWVRALGSLSAQKLDKTAGADYPFWSPDSKNIAFFADKKLKRIAVSGGSPINLGDADIAGGGAWFQLEGSTEGVILFSPSYQAGLMRVPAAGGVPAPVTKLAPEETGHVVPQFLPDGKRFLYFALGGSPGIYVQTLGSDQRTFLLATPGRAVLAPPDFLLDVRDNTLLAQHWDWSALKPLGEPISIADEVRSGGGTNDARNGFSVSSTGVLAYRSGTRQGNVYNWYTRDGKQEVPAWAWDRSLDYQHIELSPDNRRVAVVRRAGGSAQDIFLAELDGGVESRITSSGNAGDPAWSPDSRRIAYARRAAADGKIGIYQTLVGSGKETLVYPDYRYLEAWTGEGLVARISQSKGTSVVLLAAPEENATQPMAAKPRTLLDVPYNVDQMSVSPDGTRIAYMSGESGAPEVWVAAFPSFADRRKIANGAAPIWRVDGKELVFQSPTRTVMAVDVKTGATFSAGVPKALFPWTAGFSMTVHNYAMTNDGKRFLIRESPATAREEIEPMHVVLNWPSLVGK